MVDSHCKPWLIEVNTNPCLEESSMLLKKLLPQMLNEAFKLTIDAIFANALNQKQIDELEWEEIVDLKK